jgi:Protein of unknown function (DUF3455)
MLLSLALLALIASPQTPDPTLPPADAHVKATAVGLGVQVYRCAPQGDTFQWTLDGPVATLFDPATHQPVGTHSTGPTWTWNDGSSITGKVLQKRAASDPANLPWLLLETSSANTTTGMLSDVTLVRRSDTQAGVPPMACDSVHQNNMVRVPYQATYTFYTTTK